MGLMSWTSLKFVQNIIITELANEPDCKSSFQRWYQTSLAKDSRVLGKKYNWANPDIYPISANIKYMWGIIRNSIHILFNAMRI